MKPTTIYGANFTFKAPPGMPDCEDLPVMRTTINDRPAIISAWELTDQEREDIGNGRNIVLTILGNNMPPIGLNVALAVCDMCGEPVHPDEGTIGGARHKHCNGIAFAAMTPAEQEAAKDQLAEEIGEALRESPDKYVEIRPGIFLAREDIASHVANLNEDIGRLERVVRALNAQLCASGGHSELTIRVANDAMKRMKSAARECPACKGWGYLPDENRPYDPDAGKPCPACKAPV